MLRDEALQEELELLAQHVVDLARVHPGRLSALTLAVPWAPSSEVLHDVEAALANAGIDFVDVTLQRVDGPLRVLHAEYEA